MSEGILASYDWTMPKTAVNEKIHVSLVLSTHEFFQTNKLIRSITGEQLFNHLSNDTDHVYISAKSDLDEPYKIAIFFEYFDTGYQDICTISQEELDEFHRRRAT